MTDAPDYIEALLSHLADEIERVEWNRTQEEFSAPTKNAASHYETEAFEMHAYYWGDCECPDDGEHAAGCPVVRPNFKSGDFEVYWYKYLGRGMKMNREITPSEAVGIFDRCLASVRARDAIDD